jgi:vacuolar iron transporter family protein
MRLKQAPAPGDMEREHTPEAIRQRFSHGPPRSYLRDWVYGGIDGLVTPLSLASLGLVFRRTLF